MLQIFSEPVMIGEDLVVRDDRAFDINNISGAEILEENECGNASRVNSMIEIPLALDDIDLVKFGVKMEMA